MLVRCRIICIKGLSKGDYYQADLHIELDLSTDDKTHVMWKEIFSS